MGSRASDLERQKFLRTSNVGSQLPSQPTSVQTTERYLGCKQKLRHAVNDNMGIEIS